MSLRTAVAAPFVQASTSQMPRSDFVVDLSLDRDWFSPEQAKRLLSVAEGEGLVTAEEDTIELAFDPDTVSIPDEYEPDESILRNRSTFEQVLDMVVADGIDKQEAVSKINALQSDLAVTIDTAAILFARQRGQDIEDVAGRALQDI